MERNPSPPAPRVSPEAQPSTGIYGNTERIMGMIRRFVDNTASTSAAAAAQRGSTVPTLALEPVQQQQQQSMLATATEPGPSAPGLVLQLTLSLPMSFANPGPCVTNMAPDPLSLDELEMEENEEVQMEEADEEVEMEDPEEVESVKEGRFYLLPPPPPERNAGDDEPKLLILFPLAPSSSEGN